MLFINERSRSIRRASEQYVVERVVSAFDRLRGLDADQQAAVAADSGDFGMRFSIVRAPVGTPAVGDAAAVAHLVSDQLSGVEVNARERTIEIDFSRMRAGRRGLRERDGAPGAGPGAGPGPGPEAGSGGPPFTSRASPQAPPGQPQNQPPNQPQSQP